MGHKVGYVFKNLNDTEYNITMKNSLDNTENESAIKCRDFKVCDTVQDDNKTTLYTVLIIAITTAVIIGVLVLFYIIRRRRATKRQMTSFAKPGNVQSRYYTSIFEDLNVASLSYVNFNVPERNADDGISMVSLDNDDFLNSIEDIDCINYLQHHGSPASVHILRVPKDKG